MLVLPPRPALLLDPEWKVPLALFTAVSDGSRQWLHAQPINTHWS